ncbi:hypothetical protein KAU11_10430 [Candidatus Babeliales bacterium]|nr:hypothetical protein [Candidatus Babeliales bacterium]
MEMVERIKLKKSTSEVDSIIYFLKEKGKVVYVGESSTGMARPFQHMIKKRFDEIEIYKAPKEKTLRQIEERKLIVEYLPRYNRSMVAQGFRESMKDQGMVEKKEIWTIAREIKEYSITNSLLRKMQETDSYIVQRDMHFVSFEDANAILGFEAC